MSETIVKSFNIFCDTDMAHDLVTSKGDDYEIHLNDVHIDATKGQFIRLTLTNFSMFKNFTNINAHNNRFIVRSGTTSTTTSEQELNLTNHEYFNTLGQDFANKVLAGLNAITSGGGWTVGTITGNAPDGQPGVLDGDSLVASSAGNKVLSFHLTKTNHGLNANTLPKIQFYDKYDDDVISDIYCIIGGNRIKSKYSSVDTTSPSSVELTVVDADTIKVQCLYPMQKYSETFVYLRSNLLSTNLQTTSLDERKHQGGSQSKVCDAHQSDIFARFPIQNEFIHWDTHGEREYYIDLATNVNHLNFLRFRLTTKNNKSLVYNTYSKNQNTLGNLNFTMVIKCEIIQKFDPEKRFTKDPPRNVPPRFSNPQIDYDGHIR